MRPPSTRSLVAASVLAASFAAASLIAVSCAYAQEKKEEDKNKPKRGSFDERGIQPRFSGGGLDLLERKTGRRQGYPCG